MQREKLYSSHQTAFLIVGHYAFEMDEMLSDQISMLQKDNTNNKFIIFFLFHLSIACTDCRGAHAVAFIIFCFYLRKHIKR